MDYLSTNKRSAVFNLGNEQGFSVKEVIQIVEVVTGKSVDRRICSRRAGDPAILVASAGLAKRELGWKPESPKLSIIVETAWAWARKSDIRAEQFEV